MMPPCGFLSGLQSVRSIQGTDQPSKLMISFTVLAFLTIQISMSAHVTRVSAEDYWVNKILGGGVLGFVNEKETETEIRWESFGLEGQRFIYAVDKRLL